MWMKMTAKPSLYDQAGPPRNVIAPKYVATTDTPMTHQGVVRCPR